MNRYFVDAEQFICHRRQLYYTRRALECGKMTVGILGGYISEPIDTPWKEKRWPDKLTNWLVSSFPEVTVNVENAAKGATGSESALFRVEQDILSRNCDIVFVEYAVNDKDMPSKERKLCREGLIRKLLGYEKREFDVVVVYTYYGGMLQDMLNGTLYEGVAEFEEICKHYSITSVNMGAYAFAQLQAGNVRYEEWLPDKVHAGDVGSRLYAESVMCLIEDACETAEKMDYEMPEPLFIEHWGKAHKLNHDMIRRMGPWKCVRCYRIPTVERILQTTAIGAALEFEFEGTGLVLFVRINGYAAGYRIQVDDGQWNEVIGPRPEWCYQTPDWIRSDMLYGFSRGQHHVRLETIMIPDAAGSHFELCDIGIIP